MNRLRRWFEISLSRRLALIHFVMIAIALCVVQAGIVAVRSFWRASTTPMREAIGDPWVGALRETTLGPIPVLLIALLAGTVSAIVVSWTLGRRLRPLEETIRAMESGDLSRRVNDRSTDEVGRVARAFDRMADRLSEALRGQTEARKRVETLMDARRDLIANVSHDLRTPITNLAAHVEKLSERRERLEEYLPILRNSVTRVSEMIEELFEIARLDAQELRLNLEPVALSDVIDRVAGNYRGLAWEQRRIALRVESADPVPSVRADVQRVEQVLVNLVVNALRFTPEGGIVCIETEALPTAVEVRVRDTGQGIPQAALPNVFDRFYRGDPARTGAGPEDESGGGSGLGLAIVKGLVEAMGGSVSAESESGEGTCITFRLPVA